MSTLPPLGTKFRLGAEITAEQSAYLARWGYLHFEGVASGAEIAAITHGIDEVEERWLREGRTRVRGIPLFFGRKPDGSRGIQRLAFTSLFAPAVAAFVRDARFEPIRRLVGEDARVGEDEKDGVVVNRFVNLPGSAYPRLGWHTDGLRDLFYLRLPGPMLNVGLHLDDCTAENGGLRLIPGTHTQGFAGMLLGKAHFVSHRADPREICVETKAGDLTIHDGRLWHRVARSSRTGAASLRRTMYVPYLTGPREPKTEQSATPLYHVAGALLRRVRASRMARTLALGVLVAGALLLLTRHAHAAGFWNFDKGAENYARGGAALVDPSDPVAVYSNPSALAAHEGFQLTLDVNGIDDHRRFERAPDAPGNTVLRAYSAVQNREPIDPSPGVFASWNAAPIGLPRVTFGAGLYGPPRSDARFAPDGPQRYSLVESHNVQMHQALSVAVAIPEARLRVGLTGMLVRQAIDMRQDFNTFLGAPEAPGYDASAHIRAVDPAIPSGILAVTADVTDRLQIAASGQLGWTVHAKGTIDAALGDDLASQASLKGNRMRADFHMPPIARLGARFAAPSGHWDAEADVVWEGWSADDAVTFAPQKVFLVTTGGLAMRVPSIRLPTHLRDTWSVRMGGAWRPSGRAPLLRGGIFYERSALNPKDLSPAAFDLDKVGVSTGARVELPARTWLDVAVGTQYWIPARVRASQVAIPDPVHGTTGWAIGNGRYSNWRVVGMVGLGISL